MAQVSGVSNYQKVASRHRARKETDGKREQSGNLTNSVRSSRQIEDATFVLGVPRNQVTPKLLEAMSIIFNEMDSLRLQLDICKKYKHEFFNHTSQHEKFPILDKKTIYRSILKAASHNNEASERSFLVIVKVIGLEAIWRAHGWKKVEERLYNISKTVDPEVSDSIPFGYLGDYSFGLVLAMAKESEAKTLAIRISDMINKDL
ncbi:MAG: hypothetical protein VX617_01770, partial [Pseudomonadota bacterium]|nr:hypothetical protein [Pseudomonadota bacterium]